jgi:hypothetical protein
MSLRELGERFGVSRTAVAYHLKRTDDWQGTRGRRPLSDLFLCRVAADYVTAIMMKLPPVPFVADLRRASVVKARSWINLSRRAGFLTTTDQGVAGGVLTEKARSVLAEIPNV